MRDILEHLRDPVVRENLAMAAKIKKVTGSFLESQGFQEYDTPILMPKTGEKYNTTFDIMIQGKEASLADSPQICKLMLALAGYEKYYQFAHCFRPIESEAERHTRMCEFTQLDIELQNTTFSELIKLAETLIVEICKVVHREPVIKHINGLECREIYGNEMKPDIRENSEKIVVLFIKHMPLTNGERTEENQLVPCHHIFALPSGEIKNTEEESLINTTTESFDIVINGIEIGGGDLRIMNTDLQKRMMDIFDVEKERYTEYFKMLTECNGKQGGGFAVGLERLIMALTGCGDVRRTVAFPDFYM